VFTSVDFAGLGKRKRIKEKEGNVILMATCPTDERISSRM
jgi:hypothetical protein